jgi:hypothetical protein
VDAIEAIELLKSYQPPTTLQPIAAAAAFLYINNGRRLDSEHLDAIRAELACHHHDLRELATALLGLRAFGRWVLEFQDDEPTHRQIFELIGEAAPFFEPLMTALASAPQELATIVAAELRRFEGTDDDGSGHRAPCFGATAPEGTVPLRRLKPVATPPPIFTKTKNKVRAGR